MTTIPAEEQQVPQPDNLPLVFDEAIYVMLTHENGGPSLFNDSHRLKAFLDDIADKNSPTRSVFMNNCDDTLLTIYRLILESTSPTIESLNRAAMQAAQHLISRYHIDKTLSQETATMLSRGLARYLIHEGRIEPIDLKYIGIGSSLTPDVTPSVSQQGYPQDDGVTIVIDPNHSSTKSSSHEPETEHLIPPGTTRGGKRNETGSTTTQPPKPEAPKRPITPPNNGPITQNEPPTNPSGTNKLLLACAMLVTAFIAGFLIFISFSSLFAPGPIVTFDGNGALEGSVESIRLSSPDESVTLPQNSFSREGYAFGGWGSSPHDTNPKNQGDTIDIDKDTTLYAIWCTGISFDGNGATSGSTDTVYCDTSGKAILPECGYKRAGFSFAGWSTIPNSFIRHQPGESYDDPGKPIKLYTIWKYDSSVTDSLQVTKVEKNANDGSTTLCLTVTNNSDQIVDLTATISFQPSIGGSPTESEASVICLAPGDTTLFVENNKGGSRGAFSYTLDAEPPGNDCLPLYGRYDLEETSVGNQGVSIRIRNTSNDTLRLNGAYCYAVQPGYETSSDGGFALFGGDIDTPVLKPGESTSISFGNGSDVEWAELNRSYYLYGYAV